MGGRKRSAQETGVKNCTRAGGCAGLEPQAGSQFAGGRVSSAAACRVLGQKRCLGWG